jgi:hypothetical protein
VVSGLVEWQGEIDLSYDTLYLESKAINAIKPQRKSTLKRKKARSLGLAAVGKKKLPKARMAVK